MTVSSEIRKAGPFASGQVFPFSFKVFSKQDLIVLRTASGVDQQLVLDSDYAVALNEDQNNTPGGFVSLTVALTAGQTCTVLSDLAYLQETDITNRGGFYPQVIEDVLDRLAIQLQQLKEQLDRSARVAVSLGGSVDMALPTPVAGQAIGWNAAGNGLQNIQVQAAISASQWIAPTLQNSWAQQSGYAPVGYTKDAMGFVRLRGALISGTAPNTMFTLPVGFRPSETVILSTASAAGFCRITVNTNGTVVPSVAPSNNAGLDGAAFWVGV